MPDASSSGDLGILAHTVHDLATAHMFLGNFAQCRRLATQAVELQRHRDSPAMTAFALTIVGAGQFYGGEWDDGYQTLQQAEAIIKGLPASWHAPFVLAYLGMIETARGQWESASRHLGQVVAFGESSLILRPLAEQLLAEQALLRDHSVEALSRLQGVDAGQSLYESMMRPTLAWAQMENEDIASAEATIAGLRPDIGMQMPLVVTDALRVHGSVSARQGRYEESRALAGVAYALPRHAVPPR